MDGVMLAMVVAFVGLAFSENIWRACRINELDWERWRLGEVGMDEPHLWRGGTSRPVLPVRDTEEQPDWARGWYGR